MYVNPLGYQRNRAGTSDQTFSREPDGIIARILATIFIFERNSKLNRELEMFADD
jgi:hypothetical protein